MPARHAAAGRTGTTGAVVSSSKTRRMRGARSRIHHADRGAMTSTRHRHAPQDRSQHTDRQHRLGQQHAEDQQLERGPWWITASSGACRDHDLVDHGEFELFDHFDRHVFSAAPATTRPPAAPPRTIGGASMVASARCAVRRALKRVMMARSDGGSPACRAMPSNAEPVPAPPAPWKRASAA